MSLPNAPLAAARATGEIRLPPSPEEIRVPPSIIMAVQAMKINSMKKMCNTIFEVAMIIENPFAWERPTLAILKGHYYSNVTKTPLIHSPLIFISSFRIVDTGIKDSISRIS